VALKILITGDRGEDEYSMQREITSAVQDTHNLVTYLTAFSLPGCKGNHRVLVFTVRGPSFSCLRPERISIMANRMSAARHLLKALENLHNAGIVHHDLNQENVMWGIRPFDNLSKKEKYEHLGRPKKITLTEVWKQGELVTPAKVPELFLLTDTAYLGDFGMAAKAGTDVKLNRPLPWNMLYHAPERFHDKNPSFASDMWSYMCLFMDLYLGFIPWGPGDMHGQMIPRMVEILGPLPRHWKGCYAGCFGKYDYSWYDQRKKRDRKAILDSIVKKKRPEVSSVERDHVVEIMSKIFCYSPDDRLTATKLLQDSSFQAVMEIYCR